MAQNGTDSDKITARQRRAIVALLNTKTVGEAAQVAGVGERTLFRWLTGAAFKTALANAEGELIGAATRRLVGLQDKAIETVEVILDDLNIRPSIRLHAATTVLDYMLKLREMHDIEGRLAALEANLGKQ